MEGKVVVKFPHDIVVFDLECNQPSGKIIEIGAVYLTRDLTGIASEFQAYVHPNEDISEYIINLCGLKSDHLAKIQSASALPEVCQEFYTWATQKTKNIVLASWGNFDVAELHVQYPECPFRKKSIDIKSIAAWECARMGIKTEHSLSAVCKETHVKIEQPIHRGLPDARTTANVLLNFANLHKKRANFLNSIYPKETFNA